MHFEYDTEQDLGRYVIRHGPEIVHILNDIMSAHSLVTLHSDNGRDFVLTAIVGLDADAGELFVACGPEERLNQAILASEEVAVTSSHEQVRVQFVAPTVDRVQHGQECVFRLRLPAQLLRLQRREYYRLITSLTNPVKCWLEAEGEPLEALVTDISVGGIGVLYYPGGPQLRVGMVCEGSRLVLPEGGEFPLTLKVCNAYEETMKNGLLALRAGCQFLNLPGGVETEIQRYIFKVERTRRARLL